MQSFSFLHTHGRFLWAGLLVSHNWVTYPTFRSRTGASGKMYCVLVVYRSLLTENV